MRGIGRTFSRLPRARAFLAGAAILAAASGGQAQAKANQADETALAIPRLSPGGTDGVALPQPLPPSQAARWRQVFATQNTGDTRTVAALAGVDTTSPLGRGLLGHLLAGRYLGPRHHSTEAELTDWLARYPNQPDAPAIFALLKRKAPASKTPAPAAVNFHPNPASNASPEEDLPEAGTLARNPKLDQTVHDRAYAGSTNSALRLIAKTPGLSAAYGAQLRAEVAQTLFAQNEDERALRVASDAVRESGARNGLANYIAGLAAWRLGRFAASLPYFEAAAQAVDASHAIRAAGAFWAARAQLRTHNPAGYQPWLKKAARYRRTFYGLIAKHILGVGITSGLALERETLGEADVEAVSAIPGGQLAFALLQIGQTSRAEAELRRVAGAASGNTPLLRAVMLVADKAGFYDLGAELAEAVQESDGKPHDYARFPVPKLRPRHGFRLDPALVYALTRLESNFDADALSPAGARGLMQLMPQTASYIADNPAIFAHPKALQADPALNLDLGQRYVAYLAAPGVLNGDLIRVLASYNCGPGSFAKWSADIKDGGDPLLFIEAIPIDETRAFVQRALTYTWIYAARLHRPALSLIELAAGVFPRIDTGNFVPGPPPARLH